MKKVGIVGYGWVGKAMKEMFPDAVVYSNRMYSDSKYGILSYSQEEWDKKKEEYQKDFNSQVDIAFVCVPTPCPDKARLDVSAVEESIAWLESELIVVRSTVNPGDCDFFEMKYNKHICMQPEYLGETPQHPLLDSLKNPFLIIGGKFPDRKKLIDLYTTVYNANVNIRQVTNYAAEIIKLTENRAIGYKVAQIQELYDVCLYANIDFYTVRDAVYGDDPRFNLWWTFVYPEKRGFNSKCIPKDIYAWCAWAETFEYDPELTKNLLKRNDEWIKSNG